ncbi:MAG: PKD domain-containing protein, partial [Ekhidna sp.]|nr:PKD domain-containing protein [Ekhidna sp.]
MMNPFYRLTKIIDMKNLLCTLSPKNTFLIVSAILLTIALQAQEADPKPFITTWETTEADETITIPTVDGETYSYSVNWGDGHTDNNVTEDASHRYAKAGTHTVTISGTFPRIRFGALNSSGILVATAAAGQIRSVEKWGDNPWT